MSIADMWKETLKLTPRHKVALRMLTSGWKAGDVAAATGYTQARLSIIRNSVEGKAYLEEIGLKLDDKVIENLGECVIPKKVLDVRKRIQEEASSSLERLLALRDGASDEKTRAKVAIDLLDRAGYKATDKVEVTARVLASDSLVAALNLAANRKTRKTD